LTPDLKAFRAVARPGYAIPIRAEVAADTETPVSAFLKLSRGESHAFLFESVEGGERVGRWSFLGVGPRRVFTWRPGQRPAPASWLAGALAERRGLPLQGLPRFAGGWVGWLGYDAVSLFEPRVPLSGPDELGIPAACWMDFDTVVAFDGVRHRAHVLAEAFVAERAGVDRAYADAVRRVAQTIRRLQRPLPRPARRSAAAVTLRPRVSRARFEAAVARAREYIRAGDCQQIVVSQRFDAQTDVPPFELYRALRQINPSPYLLFVSAWCIEIVL
jgi:anthranilate synthase component 1